MAANICDAHSIIDRHNDSPTIENLTQITSDYRIQHYNISDTYQLMVSVEKYCIPVICVFGLFGNTVATATFLRRPLAKAPCSLYLAVRGISDNGFLLSLLLTWVSSTFKLQLSQIKIVCQSIIFLTYVCGCVSVWLCVFITFEHFILIQSPFAAKRMCCERISKMCTAGLVLFAVAVYNTCLWVIHADCSHNTEYTRLTQFLVYADALLTLILPTFLIVMQLSVIAYKLIQIIHIRKTRMSFLEIINDNGSSFASRFALPLAKVTQMLFIISLVFLGLNLPIHIIKLWLLIGTFTK